MAVSGKYGKEDIPTLGDDEPVFILRGRDKLAVPAIELYQVLTASQGSPFAESINKEIERFRSWDGVKKLPD